MGPQGVGLEGGLISLLHDETRHVRAVDTGSLSNWQFSIRIRAGGLPTSSTALSVSAQTVLRTSTVPVSAARIGVTVVRWSSTTTIV
jgi:hypothetical protein